MTKSKKNYSPVPENKSMLKIIDVDIHNFDISLILKALKEDKVILLKGVSFKKADQIISQVAEKFGLTQSLKVQSSFASILKHRKNVGQNFMTVNKRDDFQVVPPHCEGTRFSNMQLASFYCYYNTTDGGETILLNIDDQSACWKDLKEVRMKVDIGKKILTPTEIFSAKSMLQIELPRDILKKTDTIVSENPIPIPVSGIKLFGVLSSVEKAYSIILNKDVNVYWDNMSTVDFSSSDEFIKLLQNEGLLKPTSNNVELHDSAERRVWTSGIIYSNLFKNKITHKLQEGELIILNNLTWAHSTNNWNPDSGMRKVVAAFA